MSFHAYRSGRFSFLIFSQVGRTVQSYVTRFGTSAQVPQLRGRPIRHEENFLVEWTFSI